MYVPAIAMDIGVLYSSAINPVSIFPNAVNPQQSTTRLITLPWNEFGTNSKRRLIVKVLNAPNANPNITNDIYANIKFVVWLKSKREMPSIKQLDKTNRPFLLRSLEMAIDNPAIKAPTPWPVARFPKPTESINKTLRIKSGSNDIGVIIKK